MASQEEEEEEEEGGRGATADLKLLRSHPTKSLIETT